MKRLLNRQWGCGRMSLLAIPMALATSVASAQSCKTINTPLQWTISAIYEDGMTSTAIQGDGSAYVNGQSGVSAVIQQCSGSNDATLNLGSNRYISFTFGKMLASNTNTPSWASGGSTISGPGFLNVRSMASVPSGYTREQEYAFTTWLGSTVPTAPQNGTWNLTMRAPGTTFPQPIQDNTSINLPYFDSPVIVHHCPSDSPAISGLCVGIVHETWFVWSDPTQNGNSTQTGNPITQVATLLNKNGANSGEFSFPFYFEISVIQ